MQVIAAQPAEHRRGAHAFARRILACVIGNGLVGGDQGAPQQISAEFIGWQGSVAQFIEGLLHMLHGDVAGHLAGVGAAHAIGHNPYCALLARCVFTRIVKAPFAAAQIGANDEVVLVVITHQTHIGLGGDAIGERGAHGRRWLIMWEVPLFVGGVRSTQ